MMKKYLYILLFVCSLGYGQTIDLDFNRSPGFDSTKTKQLYVTEDIYFEPPHSYLTFKDSAVVISGGTNVQITNAYDSLYRVLQLVEVSYLPGDTLQFDETGYYNLFISIRGYGNTTTDWQLTRAIKRGGVTTYGNSTIDFSTTGGNNRNGGFTNYVVDALPGDKLWFVLTRTSGTGDFTIVSSTWKVQLYFKRG